jgi:ESX secretion-associated protein EspG
MTLGAVETDPLEISALEFDVLWEHFYGLDQMPLVLKVPSPGRTDTERARIVRSVWDGLARRGLGTPVDPHPVLVRLLDLLRRPDREIDGRLWVGGELRVLVAATGDDAVLATLSGGAAGGAARGTLKLRGAEATGLPRFALSVLPPMPAGPGQSITLPTADFTAAAAEATKQEELAVSLRNRGVRDADAKALSEMIGDIVNRGQFGSAVRDKWGRRVRATRVISFFDTADGRYLQVRRAEEGTDPWTTISPADHRRMLQHLTELHEEQQPG